MRPLRAWQSNVRTATKLLLSSCQNLKASDPTRSASNMKAITSRRLICATSRSRSPANHPIRCRSGRTSSTIRQPASLGVTAARPSPVFIRDLDGLLGGRAARTSSVPRLQVLDHSQTASESTVDADRRADRALHPKNWGSEEVSAERAPLILNSQSTTLK